MNNRVLWSLLKLWGRGFWESRWAVQTCHGDQGGWNVFGMWESTISSLIQWWHIQLAKPHCPTSHPQVMSNTICPHEIQEKSTCSDPSNNTCALWKKHMNWKVIFVSCQVLGISLLLIAVNNTIFKGYFSKPWTTETVFLTVFKYRYC